MDDYLLIVLIISVFSGIITAIILSSKGYSYWGGWFLGFLLGIIGLVISLFIPFNSEKVEIRKFQHGQLVQCPYCKELIREGASICKHCREKIRPMDVIRFSDQNDGNLNEAISCIECGAQIPANREKCPKCGWSWE